LLLIAVATSIRVVPQATILVVERFGKYNSTLRAGINFLLPFIDQVSYSWTEKEQVIDVDKQDTVTRDNVSVSIDGVLYYKIVDARAASYGVQNLELAIIQLAQTTMRAAIGKMELDKLFEERDSINGEVVKAVGEAAQAWGAHVLRYEVKSLDMPATITEAMERQMQAERVRRATVTTAEGEKQAKVLRAEGERDAAIAQAEGDAKATVARAEAQAQALRLVAEQLNAQGGDKAAQLEVAREAVSAFAGIAGAGNTLVLQGQSATPAGLIAQAMSVFGAVNRDASLHPSAAAGSWPP